jgi:hypothetical protein
MQKLSESAEIVLLETKFIIPMIIGQMLEGLEPLDQVAEFTIHDMIGRMEPDTALLCIALSTRRIAKAHAHLPIANVLEIESENIIYDYAPLWLANAAGEKIDETEILNLLENLPEDFESLSVLIKTTQASILRENDLAYRLCEILSFQSESFKNYTEDYFEYQEKEKEINALSEEDNIIAFPISSRRTH